MCRCECLETHNSATVCVCMCTRVFSSASMPSCVCVELLVLGCCRVIFYTRQKKAVEGGNELFSLAPSRIPPSDSLLYPAPSLPSTSILSTLSPPLFCSLSPSARVRGAICDCEIGARAVTRRKANRCLIICLPGSPLVRLCFTKKVFFLYSARRSPVT